MSQNINSGVYLINETERGIVMNQTEWKIIYEKYRKELYFYALSLTGNIADAEDLLQEAFLKAFLSYEATGSIKYWLITVVKHEFFNLQRKRKKESNDDINQSSSPDVLEGIIENEERRQLYLAIQKLPSTMKEILIQSVYLHLSDKEIADLNKITQENVRQIKSRAKKKLLQILEEESK